MIDQNSNPPSKIADFTQIPETGDYDIDCATGREFGHALITMMAATGATPMLGMVVREFVTLGRWTAVHTGFFQRLADQSASTMP
jgi:hypothetical protein